MEYAFIWGIVVISLIGITGYMRNSLSARVENIRQDVNSVLRSHEATTPFGYGSPLEIVNLNDIGPISRLEAQVGQLDSALGSVFNIANIPIGLGQRLSNANNALSSGNLFGALASIIAAGDTVANAPNTVRSNFSNLRDSLGGRN